MQTLGQSTVGRKVFGSQFRISSLWRLAVAWLLSQLEIRRQRHALAAMTHRQLEDIGLTPEQVRNECGRSLWIL